MLELLNQTDRAPGETEETYMLYKLLAYAIQELDDYANPENLKDWLDQGFPIGQYSNRAQLALKAIHDFKPHFFSGYARYIPNKNKEGSYAKTVLPHMDTSR